MIIVEPHETRGEEACRRRREGIKAFAACNLVMQPASIEDLVAEVEKGIAEAKQYQPTYAGLVRVIFIGTWGSNFHRYTVSRMAPGETLVWLPVEHAWDEIDKEKDKVAAAVARFEGRQS